MSSDTIRQLKARMQESIIGQADVIDRLIIGLLAHGNLLVEGLPGLAKTRAIQGGDPEAGYQAMLLWLARLVPDMDTPGFADTFGDESLRRNVNALSSQLFNAETALPTPRELKKGLAVARARCIEQVTVASQSALPSLNP